MTARLSREPRMQSGRKDRPCDASTGPHRRSRPPPPPRLRSLPVLPSALPRAKLVLAMGAPSGESSDAITATFDAVLLLAHGARDPNWRKPFERLHADVRARLGAIPVVLAFLELAAPTSKKPRPRSFARERARPRRARSFSRAEGTSPKTFPPS